MWVLDTLTLPTASGIPGRIYIVKAINVGGGNVTVDGNGAETIDGVANFVLNSANEAKTIISDGTNWRIIDEIIIP